jgi:hypothetical protein
MRLDDHMHVRMDSIHMVLRQYYLRRQRAVRRAVAAEGTRRACGTRVHQRHL